MVVNRAIRTSVGGFPAVLVIPGSNALGGVAGRTNTMEAISYILQQIKGGNFETGEALLESGVLRLMVNLCCKTQPGASQNFSRLSTLSSISLLN